MSTGNTVALSDEALIAQAINGNKASLDGLCKRYWKQLYLFFAHFIQTADAEDLAQETQLRLIAKLEQYQRGRPVGPWIMAIAHNVLIDYFRRVGRRKEVANLEVDIAAGPERGHGEWKDSLVEAEFEDDMTVVLEKYADEFCEAARACRDGLTPARRAVWLLSLSEVGLKDIAQILNVSYGAAASYLHFARKAMRSCLERKGYFEVRPGTELPPEAEIVSRSDDPSGISSSVYIHVPPA